MVGIGVGFSRARVLAEGRRGLRLFRRWRRVWWSCELETIRCGVGALSEL